MELRMFSALFCSSSRSVLKLSSPEEAVVRGKGIARTSRRKLERRHARATLQFQSDSLQPPKYDPHVEVEIV